MENNRVIAVLVDTASIQQYIFSGNRLKENLGGSHLVKTLIDSKSPLLDQALQKVAPGHPGVDAWLNPTDKDRWVDGVMVGYVGGGNALLFFAGTSSTPTITQAREFIKTLSRLLLIHAPGLKSAFGMTEFSLNEDKEIVDYQKSMRRLHDDLKANKRRFFPQTTVMKHGITAECPNSDEAVEAGRKENEGSPDERLVSAVSKTRRDAASASHTALCTQVAAQLGLDYTFPEELEQLGQQDTRSYIAVVHIDGNGVGQRFRNCKSLHDARTLSQQVSDAGSQAFAKLTDDAVSIVKHADYREQFVIKFPKTDDPAENAKLCLPFRPIILGGDDITFVCEGRLGIHLAERFISFLEEKSAVDEAEKITSCAGVVIVNSKYPFAQAYAMAEALCASAKKKSRDNGNASYLDVLVSSSGISGTLDEVRRRLYAVGNYSLAFGPYLIGPADVDESLIHLKRGMRNFREKWPTTKLLALREYLSEGRRADDIKDLALSAAPLYEAYTQTRYHECVWDEKSPYFEMIELLEFYPAFLLTEGLQ